MEKRPKLGTFAARRQQAFIDYHPDFEEYKVHRGPGTNSYYTDDKQDAIGTARAMYGDDVVLKHRRKRYIIPPCF